MLKLRMILFGLACALLVASALLKGPAFSAVAAAAFGVLVVVLLVSRGKPNAAIRSTALFLCLTLATIIAWKGHTGAVHLLITGSITAIFGVMAIREFSAKKHEEE
jgi:hypothetical protein